MQLHIHQLHLKCIIHKVRTLRLVLTLLWHYHLHGNLHSICCFHTYGRGLDLLMIHAVHFDHNLLIVLSLQMRGSSHPPFTTAISLPNCFTCASSASQFTRVLQMQMHAFLHIDEFIHVYEFQI